LFSAVNGFELSRNARINHDAFEYVYGEICFAPFIALLSLAKPDENTVFYDLGSGIGKAVIACAMVYNVKSSCGVELFASLHQAACERHARLESTPDYKLVADKICFMNNNFLNRDLNKATLVFINATGLFGQTWEDLVKRLEQSTHCNTVITTSKSLKSSVFVILHTTSVEMSWGVAAAYVHERIKIN
jgi:hypothetical protein